MASFALMVSFASARSASRGPDDVPSEALMVCRVSGPPWRAAAPARLPASGPESPDCGAARGADCTARPVRRCKRWRPPYLVAFAAAPVCAGLGSRLQLRVGWRLPLPRGRKVPPLPPPPLSHREISPAMGCRHDPGSALVPHSLKFDSDRAGRISGEGGRGPEGWDDMPTQAHAGLVAGARYGAAPAACCGPRLPSSASAHCLWRGCRYPISSQQLNQFESVG